MNGPSMSDSERGMRDRPASRHTQRPARLRDPLVIARQRAVLATGAAAGFAFGRGAWDALGWLMTGGRGPLTGELVTPPVPARAIVHELAAAEAVIYEQPVDQELPSEPGATDRCRYAAGVEHALMWAEMVTPEPPGAMSAAGPAANGDESRSAGGAAVTDC